MRFLLLSLWQLHLLEHLHFLLLCLLLQVLLLLQCLDCRLHNLMGINIQGKVLEKEQWVER